jgi:hypothetical protein
MHTIRMEYDTDRLALVVDGSSEGTIDSSVDIADALDRIDVGADNAGAGRSVALITRIAIYRYPRGAA